MAGNKPGDNSGNVLVEFDYQLKEIYVQYRRKMVENFGLKIEMG
jgi:hypothetical protein